MRNKNKKVWGIIEWNKYSFLGNRKGKEEVTMKYNNIKEGIFRSRPNRFLAMVEIDGTMETCHVKNTGRCKELLQDGASVYVEESENPNRKTKYSLIQVRKGERLINMDSQAPNKVVHEWLQTQNMIQNIIEIKPEYTYGNSRIDFFIQTKATEKELGRKILIEVKGVTLEEDGIVRFPDAPTKRGVKHIKELTEAVKAGYETMIIFVTQMKDVTWFEPNDSTHLEFGQALRDAKRQGVGVYAFDCEVTKDTIRIGREVAIKL